MQKFTIKGNFPSLNEYINACRRNPYEANAMKQRDEAIVKYSALKVKPATEYPVIIHFDFYEKNYKRDVDNVSGYAHKIVLDALVKKGILKDDSIKYVKNNVDSFEVDKSNPRIEVTIKNQGEKNGQKEINGSRT